MTRRSIPAPPSSTRSAALALAMACSIAAASRASAQPVGVPVASAGPSSAALRDRWADSASRLIDRAVRTSDRAGVQAARTLLDRALAVLPDDPLLQHYAGYAAYREAVMAMARGEGDRGRAAAQALLGRADSLLERSAGRLPLPESFALRASVIGMQIGVGGNPAAGMWLGPKASATMDEALRRGPRNPRVLLLRGISAYNTPKLWGGGAERARTYLADAAALFGADRPASPLPAWGAAEVQVWMGRSWRALGQPDSARAAYARAKALEPDNPWLTRVLIPELERTPAAPGTGGR
jgi:tetratricopeptide (TPR) repeat protein